VKLSASARETIKWFRPGEVTIAGYTRHRFADGVWHGDACGCLDDRCIGYHHDEGEECGCLPAWLEQYYLEALAPSWFVLEVSGDGSGGLGPLGAEVRELGPWLSRGDAEIAQANWQRSGYTAEVAERSRVA
jgi:hypothetical protein